MRDGETRASDYVDLVLRQHRAPRPSRRPSASTLAQLLTAARFYVAPAQASRDTIERVGDALLAARTRRQRPGSDAQFQFVKVFAAIASTPCPRRGARCAARAATRVSTGLDIDGDLDWELLEGLVLNGAAGAARDRCGAGSRPDRRTASNAAARATATIPTAEAKRAAFDSILSARRQVELSRFAALARATPSTSSTRRCSSRWCEPYFDAIPTIWKTRSYKIAEATSRSDRALPRLTARARVRELVERTKAWLDANPELTLRCAEWSRKTWRASSAPWSPSKEEHATTYAESHSS